MARANSDTPLPDDDSSGGVSTLLVIGLIVLFLVAMGILLYLAFSG
ncbi:hypothetical protein L083_3702 [Actinoplanes sp. N902-109]|nr:hypothetical protein L083_3702 [Actinoplanes sp. N902-109]